MDTRLPFNTLADMYEKYFPSARLRFNNSPVNVDSRSFSNWSRVESHPSYRMRSGLWQISWRSRVNKRRARICTDSTTREGHIVFFFCVCVPLAKLKTCINLTRSNILVCPDTSVLSTHFYNWMYWFATGSELPPPSFALQHIFLRKLLLLRFFSSNL